MTIEFNNTHFTQFFGADLVPPNVTSSGVTWMLDYAGHLMKYQVIICCKDQVVSVSGDPETPFGADSFFEINVPCDSIAQCPDEYYPGNTGLAFWYGDRTNLQNMTMMILKRPDGDLKVWPAIPWPTNHPLQLANTNLNTETRGITKR